MIGLAKEQIMVGIPTYGKRFTLYSKYLNHPGSLAVSSNGDSTYSEVCDFLNLNKTVQVRCFPSTYHWPCQVNIIDFPLTESGPTRQSGLRLQWLRLDKLRGREQHQSEGTLDKAESLWWGNALQLKCRRFSLSLQRHSISTAPNCARCTYHQLKASCAINSLSFRASLLLSHSHSPLPAIKPQLAVSFCNCFKIQGQQWKWIFVIGADGARRISLHFNCCCC